MHRQQKLSARTPVLAKQVIKKVAVKEAKHGEERAG